jgi:dipeptidyl aminopeptidase/acylaminoacyl peptidase
VYWDDAGFWSVSPVGAPPEHLATVDFDRYVAHGPGSADVTPDGSAIATIGRALDGEIGIWTATLPGATFERYEPGPLAAQAIHNPPSLRFSPDGRQLLLFWNAGPERGEEVWLMPFPPDANRPARRVLDRLPLALHGPQVSWLPDNRRIVVATGATPDARRGLYIADTESGAFRQFSSGPADQNVPAVSPDGERVAFTEFKEDFDIVTVDLQTAAVTVSIATGRAETMPAWAAAKDALVWVTDINGGPEIWLREPSRPDRPLVTARDFPTSDTQFLVGPALSPDGARLIYQRVAGGGSESYLWMSAVAAGSPPQRVTNADAIELAGAWSPDGNWYVYRTVDGGFRTLKVSTAGLAEPQTLFIDPREGNWLLAWSPDSEWILDLNRGVLLSADGESTRALGRDNRACAFAPTDLLYCFRPRRSDGLFPLVATDFDGNDVRTIGALGPEHMPAANVGPGMRLSPTFDGKGLTYSVRRSEENLWLMEGLATVPLP